MSQIQLTDYAGLEVGTLQSVAAEMAGLGSLERVLNWGRSLTPPRDIEEILTQDEYTHDVVMRYDQELFLVFDTT
jgi:hypothetical protein